MDPRCKSHDAAASAEFSRIIDVPEGAVAGSRAVVSLPDDGSARHATVTIAFPPGLSTGQELTVALEV